MSADFSNVLTAIHNDEVICYPTEGVWGLGCHPQSEIAFEKLLDIKKRPMKKGVILLAGKLSQLSPYIMIDDEITRLFATHRNQFITFVVPKSSSCPDYLSGQFDSVAVRVTNYAPLRELCLQAQSALVSTSANISGQPPVNTVQLAKQAFGDAVSVYVDMPLGGSDKSSRIVRWEKGNLTILRN